MGPIGLPCAQQPLLLSSFEPPLETRGQGGGCTYLRLDDRHLFRALAVLTVVVLRNADDGGLGVHRHREEGVRGLCEVVDQAGVAPTCAQL